MMKYFMTDNQVIHEEEKLQDGVWVRMISPTQEECEEIADVLNVDIDDIKAALDEEESSRIELQDGYTLILVDVPTTEIRHDKQSYTTIPLGIILTQDVIVTVCTEDTPVLKNFVINRVKEFSTKKRLRFVYQIPPYCLISLPAGCAAFLLKRRCALCTRFCTAPRQSIRPTCASLTSAARRLRSGSDNTPRTWI